MRKLLLTSAASALIAAPVIAQVTDTAPADPGAPATGQTLPAEPTPIDPGAPTDPAAPVDPIDPAAPADPMDPAAPADPLDPGAPVGEGAAPAAPDPLAPTTPLTDAPVTTPADGVEFGATALGGLTSEDLAEATVFDVTGEEVGQVYEVLTFEDNDQIRAVVVEADDRQVELQGMQFNVFEDDDAYRIELVLDREGFDALPDYEPEDDENDEA